jgi:threonine 3-dehydrogenase
MADNMLAIMKAKPAAGAELADAPVPRPGDDEVLCKVLATSICGTDKHIYQWDEWSAGRIKPPMIFGHEFAGEVVEVGKIVRGIKVGDFVSAETHIPCKTCYQCRTGQEHICHNLKILGVDVNGCFAQFVTIPESCCWKNDPSLDPAFASIQEPFGNAAYTVLESDVAGRQIAVIGDGPIAAFAVGIARAVGAAPIYSVGKHQIRIDTLKKMGADVTYSIKETSYDDMLVDMLDRTGGNGLDVVLDMVGSQEAVDLGLKLVKKGGTYTAFGIPGGKIEFDLANGIIFKGANVIGINGRKMFDTWFRAANLLNTGRVDPSPVITHRFMLGDFIKAMETVLSPTREANKVVLVTDEKYLK